MLPKYSVVIPTLNRSGKLRKAIDSVLSQSVDGELEIVVIDNCSDDDTQAVLAEPGYAAVRVVRQPMRVPRIQNFMTALRSATGDYVSILFDDEEMMPGNLLIKGQVMDEHPEVIAVTSSIVKREADGRVSIGSVSRSAFTIEARGEYLRNMFVTWPGGLPQVLMRRSTLDHLELEARDEPLDADAFVMKLSTLGAIATLPDGLVTETVTDSEMVRNGLLERVEVTGEPGNFVSLPTIWFGWSHYRMRIEHLLQSNDLSNQQIRSLRRAAYRVFRKDVWKAAYCRWQVTRRMQNAIALLLRAAAFDPGLLIPPVDLFLVRKPNAKPGPMAKLGFRRSLVGASLKTS
ncbi:glycosyltransferase family 2 protein [Nodosilinea nodulosa]|uniref:glycosyltransferase family 2 protein n=1 Tax=Nodosilinea nodulosa TaxID=416001 RepID=UPI000304C5CA|nr:glycosyltransferase family 2 protein [Nodosilinea nodulosa]